MTTTSFAKGPLDGIKVLDLGVLLAGPLVGAYFGDLGADVVKVERRSGDPCRATGYHVEGISLMWKFLGRNKRPIALDFDNADDLALLENLIQEADILIENFKPRTLDKFGLSSAVLRSLNPRLIVTRISGFGQKGPYSKRAGFGTVAESMTGFVNLNGWPDGPPTLAPIALADTAAAMAAAICTLAALWQRGAEGLGQEVDVSLLEPLYAYFGPQLLTFMFTGAEPKRMGNRLDFASPRGAYECGDGKWLALSGASPNTARSVFEAIDRPDMNDDPRFSDNAGRMKHVDLVDDAIANWARTMKRDEAVERLRATGAAVGPVYTMADTLEDPHFREREVFKTIDDPELGEITLPNIFGRFSETPAGHKFAGKPVDADRVQIISDWLDREERDVTRK